MSEINLPPTEKAIDGLYIFIRTRLLVMFTWTQKVFSTLWREQLDTNTVPGGLTTADVAPPHTVSQVTEKNKCSFALMRCEFLIVLGQKKKDRTQNQNLHNTSMELNNPL